MGPDQKHLENICCVYSLEAPHRGASNEYTQYVFSLRNKKIRKNVNFRASIFWLDKWILIRGQIVKFDNSTALPDVRSLSGPSVDQLGNFFNSCNRDYLTTSPLNTRASSYCNISFHVKPYVEWTIESLVKCSINQDGRHLSRMWFKKKK